jgi:hypothetical protein
MKKNKLKAVYDTDLAGYLKSLGLYEAILNEEILCKYCGNKITIDNLEVIVPSSEGVEIICRNENCLNQL